MSFFFKALDTSTSLRPKAPPTPKQLQQPRNQSQQQMAAASPFPGIRTPAEAGT